MLSQRIMLNGTNYSNYFNDNCVFILDREKIINFYLFNRFSIISYILILMLFYHLFCLYCSVGFQLALQKYFLCRSEYFMNESWVNHEWIFQQGSNKIFHCGLYKSTSYLNGVSLELQFVLWTCLNWTYKNLHICLVLHNYKQTR